MLCAQFSQVNSSDTQEALRETYQTNPRWESAMRVHSPDTYNTHGHT